MKSSFWPSCFFLIILILLLKDPIQGQSNTFIEGYIYADQTKAPIEYAHVINKDTGKGTITNEEGYFKLDISSWTNEIEISFIGFEVQTISINDRLDIYNIYLKENRQLLGEVVVSYKEDPFLYELLHACRLKINTNKEVKKAKAYFEQKSWKDNEQVELVEAYYNIDLSKRVDVRSLSLKAGRIAVKHVGNGFFITKENTKAISSMKLIDESFLFPTSPLYYRKNKMRRKFFLDLEKKYVDQNQDSIYVISYQAKKAKVKGFSGNVWVLKDKQQILKITYEIQSANRYPFIPLFPDHNIEDVRFQISKSFKEEDLGMFLNYVDFSYQVKYGSRFKHLEDLDYTLSGKAILYVYDYGSSFFQPRFSFSSEGIEDYLKINAYPYNSFFWDKLTDYQLSDKRGLNEAFYSDNETMPHIFTDTTYFKKGMYKVPFVAWSQKRIFLKEHISDTIANPLKKDVLAPKYNLDVEIFLDWNAHNDSINIITATIMDPFETYFYYPITAESQCFFNLYFDLCEIQRRRLANELEIVRSSREKVEGCYDRLMGEFIEEREQFLNDTNRGLDMVGMKKWNTVIKDELNIDNIQQFFLYQDIQNND